MPGKPGNTNALAHGKYGYLAAGRLPPGCSYIRKMLSRFKAALEQAIRDNGGEVTLYEAATISTALRHEARALIAGRWLRDQADKMDASTRLAYLREVGTASDSRDRCLRALKLDREPDVYQALYSMPVLPIAQPKASGPADGPEVIPDAEGVSDGDVGDDEGKGGDGQGDDGDAGQGDDPGIVADDLPADDVN